MKLVYFQDIPLEEVNIEGAKKVKMRWLISQKDSAPNFALRMFEVEPGGETPFHIHEWEHEVFVLQGTGSLVTEKNSTAFKKWDVIYVDPNIRHQFKNNGDELLRFLCVIPHNTQKKSSQNPLSGKTVSNC